VFITDPNLESGSDPRFKKINNRKPVVRLVSKQYYNLGCGSIELYLL